MSETRFRCTVCGKLTIGGRLPATKWAKGDGTYRYPRRHKIDGKYCKGCYLEADWVDVNANGEVMFESLAGWPS